MKRVEMSFKSMLAVCVLLGAIQFTLSVTDFSSSPGVVKRDVGGQAQLTWNTSQLFDATAYTASVQITEKSSDTNILVSNSAGCNNMGDTRLNCIIPETPGPTVGFSITGITDIDGDQYICSVKHDVDSSFVRDDNGYIYVFQHPSVEVIGVMEVTVGESVTLSCNATSQSLPIYLRGEAVIDYTGWTIMNPPGNHVINPDNTQVTIATTVQGNNDATFNCQAKESGSSMSPTISSTRILKVSYKPGQATASPESVGPQFESENPSDIQMTCTVDDPGNPTAVYEWTKDGVIEGDNTGSRTIDAGTLSVSDHNGLWRCTPLNTAGRGQPDTITVTVYAKPVFTVTPSNQTVVAEPQALLNVSCSIRGKPAPVVTWQYEGGDLPAGIDLILEEDVTVDKLSTVTRRLTWTTDSTVQERRSAGGIYTCTGTVYDMYSTSQQIGIDTQYEPYNTMITGVTTVVENDTVTLTCSASCNPNCNYKWTKPNNEIINGGQLQFVAKRQDQGTYKCTANNGIGNDEVKQTEFQVQYPPETSITVTPGGDLMQDTDVTLTCAIDSRPTYTSVTWTNITESVDKPLAEAGRNNTHSWLTLLDVDILHSGTYQCTADNGVRGSPGYTEENILIYGPARWYKLDPPDQMIGLGVGNTTDFQVWVIARPLPTQNQWKWSFTPDNSTSAMTDPGQVYLNVSGDKAVLTITEVTIEHFGNYSIWTGNKHGGWKEDEFVFNLKAQSVPVAVTSFQITDVTAVSIKVQWVTGFNGGLDQTFTIRYENVASGMIMEKTVADTGLGSGQLMTENITDGIDPETPYQLTIISANQLGETVGGQASTTTLVLAAFDENGIDIKIKGAVAEIHFIITGPLTHIGVQNCAEDPSNLCVTEDVYVPSSNNRRNRRQTDVVNHDFTEDVVLSDPEATKFTFSFWLYDDDVLLYEDARVVPIDTSGGDGGGNVVIIGVVVGILLAVVVVAVFIALWRKGILPKKKPKDENDKQSDDAKHSSASEAAAALYVNVSTPVLQEAHKSTDKRAPSGTSSSTIIPEQQYEMILGPPPEEMLPSVYEALNEPKMNIVPASSIILDSILSDGQFYNVWDGKIKCDATPPLRVVIKKIKEVNDVYAKYLRSQSVSLCKLRNEDSVIGCLGKTSDNSMLILDNAPLGNLTQYLEAMADAAYANVESVHTVQMEMNFIHQIIRGVLAVHKLQPPALFYCMSVSHVLLTSRQQCKITGFASADNVRSREKWEEEHQRPRPVRWLSPEAIKLNHIVQSDVWSLALLIRQIFSTGKAPYDDKTDDEARQQILGGMKPLKPSGCSDELYDLMSRCWMHQPYNRPTVEEVQLQCLELCQYEPI